MAPSTISRGRSAFSFSTPFHLSVLTTQDWGLLLGSPHMPCCPLDLFAAGRNGMVSRRSGEAPTELFGDVNERLHAVKWGALCSC